MCFWCERAVFQRSAFGRSTAGNDVVATIFIRIFLFFFPFFPFFFSVVTFSHRRSARIKKLIIQKLTGAPRGRHLSRPRWPFWGPLAAILDFVGGELTPPSPLGWYSYLFSNTCFLINVTLDILPNNCNLILIALCLLLDTFYSKLVTWYLFPFTYFQIHVFWYMLVDKCKQILTLYCLPNTCCLTFVNLCFSPYAYYEVLVTWHLSADIFSCKTNLHQPESNGLFLLLLILE